MSLSTPSYRRPQAAGAPLPSTDDARCDCGNLLARWTAAGLEIKCRRCKRRVVLPVESIGRGPPNSPRDRD